MRRAKVRSGPSVGTSWAPASRTRVLLAEAVDHRRRENARDQVAARGARRTANGGHIRQAQDRPRERQDAARRHAPISTLRRANANAIAVRIAERNFPPPWSLFNRHTEFFGDGLDIANGEIDERIRPGIARVFREE